MKSRTLKSRFLRGSASTSMQQFGTKSSKERLTSFANMVNIFMGPNSTVVSPRSSADLKSRESNMGKKKSQMDVRIRKSRMSQMNLKP